MALVRIARIAALILALGAVAAGAQEAQQGLPLARFEHWDVHVVNPPTGKVCFVASRPTASQPQGVLRSEILFMVSKRPQDNVTNEAYAQMGYPLAGEVTVAIDGGDPFAMTLVVEEGAWLPTDLDDDRLTAAMRRGRTMVVRGRSTRGTNTTDTYSLQGVTAALDRAARECQ